MAKKTKKTDPNTFANAAPNTLFAALVGEARDGRVADGVRLARDHAIDNEELSQGPQFVIRVLWFVRGSMLVSCRSHSVSGRLRDCGDEVFLYKGEVHTWDDPEVPEDGRRDDAAAHVAWLMGR